VNRPEGGAPTTPPGPEREPVRVGVLGTGAIAQIVHLPILTERHDVDVVAVSDREAHKARAIAERFGVARVLGDRELQADDDIEAVFICTPNYLHEDQAMAALEAGKDVLVERPLALTAEGAARVAAAAEASGRKVVVGMSHRWRPDVSALRSFVAGHELGEPYAVRGSWLNRKLPLARTTWRQHADEAGGGVLMDLGVQALDLMLWLVDYPEVVRVKAATHVRHLEVEDGAHVMAEVDGGGILSAEVSWDLFSDQDRHHIRVMGTEGTGSLPPLSVHKQLGGRPMDVTPRQPRPRGGENPYTNAYRREIDHFIRTVMGTGDAPPPTEQAALMGLIEGAYRSAREGCEVEL
jgi:predicted dehydrogenase